MRAMHCCALLLTLFSVLALADDDAHACGNSCQVNANVRLIKGSVAIGIAGWSGDHTWANAWSCTDKFDFVENYAASGCAATNASCTSCSWAYTTWNQAWGGQNCTSTDYLRCQYDWAAKLTYGITGVCHQASNRANQIFSNIPWVKDAGGVGGSGLSYLMWCNCGSFGPGGSCYSC